MKVDPDVTYIGRVEHRSDRRDFGIRQNDRFFHMYIIGKTGTGKSTLLKDLALQDLRNGRGFALFDPHGDLARELASHFQGHRPRDTIYLDASDPEQPWSFNPLANIPEGKRSLAAAGLVEVFKKMWSEDWGPRLEHLLRNVVFALLARDGSTLADIPPLLTDRTFRAQVLADVHNEQVRQFWEKEFNNYSPAFRAVVTAPLENKIGALLTDPLLYGIFTGTENSLDLRRVMDDGKVLLVNLDKGRIGEGPATILGSFLVSHISLAGLQRSDRAPTERRDFVLYLDEFQVFATESLITMMSELRKYRVGLVLAHQHLAQLQPTLRDAVFGNVGTLLSFRVGSVDAPTIAKELSHRFGWIDLISLPRFHLYIRLMIEGEAAPPFSACT